MPAGFWAGVGVTAIATLVLLVAERQDLPGTKRAAKPTASIGFLLAAWGAGAFDTSYGQIVFAGLVLSLVGDVLLLWETPRPFLAGLTSFLLGHVAFAAAFFSRGVDTTASLTAFVLAGGAAVAYLRWLWGKLPPGMPGPVAAYVLVITAMVALGVGTVWTAPNWPLVVGAFAFALSDVSVAQDRFVRKAFVNRAWGLPLYFGAQLLLAASTKV